MRRSLVPITAENSIKLNRNPDRGFRLEIHIKVDELAALGDETAMKTKAAELIAGAKDGGESIVLAQTYFYLYGYRECDLPSVAFKAMDAFMEVLADHGLKAVLRFAYARDMLDPESDIMQGWMLRHMLQLIPFLQKHQHRIHVFQAGFVGAWGEWHSFFYPLDRPLLIDVIANYMLPPKMYLQVRQPDFKNMLPQDGKRLRDIGYHNDAFFGKTSFDEPIGTGDIEKGKPKWFQIRNEAAYAPQDGELFWSSQNNSIHADGYESIEQFSEHRFTSFSVLHGYADADKAPDCTMERWKRQPLTEAWLDEHHVLYQPSWFFDKEGNHIDRNVFEFVRDHLGYRIELQTIDTRRTKDGILVELCLVNYGFAAAFNLESGFAILNENGDVVCEEPVGEPSKWYNRPVDYDTSVSLQHRLTASMPLPSQSGNYRLAFYLRNTSKTPAFVANEIEYCNEYAVLESFSLS